LKSTFTRFRAYRLGCPGSSFSYFADGHFTVIEGRLTEESRPQLEYEMAKCGVESADTLHITSWDSDHCNKFELMELLNLIQPMKIECPGYNPYKDRGHGEDCLQMIGEYRDRLRNTGRKPQIEHITPEHIRGLQPAERKAYRDTYYNPEHLTDNANDNSTVKHFRRGCFNVLSLGDVESPNIGSRLRRSPILRRETDVMILAHHGADNGFTTKKFLRHLEPSLAICSADYGNQYDHPRQEIKDLLHEEEIWLMTTKTGDVIVRSVGDHTGEYQAVNLIGKSTKESSKPFFFSKKFGILDANGDTIKQRYGTGRRYPR
jgi:competence protein ComEC